MIDVDNPYSSDLALANTHIKTDNEAFEEDDPRLEEEFWGLRLDDAAVRDNENETDRCGIDPGRAGSRLGAEMPSWLHTHTKLI